MEEWVRDIPTRSGSSSSRRGNQFNRPATDKHGPKKPRLNDDTLHTLARAIRAVGQETGDNSKKLRALQGLAYLYVLCPKDDALVKAAAVEPTPEDRLLQHLRSWSILECELSQHEKVEPAQRKVLKDHASRTASISELVGSVEHCHLQPTYSDPNLYLVQFAVGADMLEVATALTSALVQIGGTVKHMGPPRTKFERRSTEALKQLEQLLSS